MRMRNLVILGSLLFTALPAMAETLKLGRYQDQGLQHRLGAFLAVAEINAEGGIMGRQVELVIRNTRSDPERDARNTAELIDKKGVEIPLEAGYERGQQFVQTFSERYKMRPSSAAASAYSTVYQYRDGVQRAGTTRTSSVIRALEGHQYTLLKDQQEWRAFDHQNVQSVYAVKARPREDVLADPYSSNYFEIVHSMTGPEAARTLEEWQRGRREAEMALVLQ